MYCSAQNNLNTSNNKVTSITSSYSDKINELLGKYAEYGTFNGSVLVAKEGKVIFKKGFGLANMEWDIPNQADTKFRIASVTKQFTAVLIMQLIAENKLSLNLPISNFTTGYPKEIGDKITIHHLLTHTSGIPNYTSFPDYWDNMGKATTPKELIKLFAEAPLEFETGERFSYSNSGYAILGVIIEEITGKPYDKVLQEKILLPLKMNHTGLQYNTHILKNSATGYDKNGTSFITSKFIDMSVAYSAGGMYSTVEDLYIWNEALYSEKLLTNQSKELMFTKHIPAWDQHYGYGFNISERPIGNTKDLITTIDHDGIINGFSSLILRIPSHQSSIILLNNTGGAPLYEISQAITGIILDKSYDLPKKSVATEVLKQIQSEGVMEATSFFNEIKNNKDYILDVNEMNSAGYFLLQSGATEKAVTMFKLNTEAFPNSSNTYDSYAESLMTYGNKTYAIENYKKSLELNPDNENAIQMLQELGLKITREDLYILKSDSLWQKKIFTFPLPFARDINFVGFEESHFPTGWSNPEAEQFWSYIFAWKINLTEKMKNREIETLLQTYFDGLIEVVNKDKTKIMPNSVAKFSEEKMSENISIFTGTIDVFDAFATNEIITLNAKVEEHYCKKEDKSILVFRFSPKKSDAEIWRKLNEIKLKHTVCND
jgi:CubicO group peptidase (beta-lactamase class C family)